MAKHRSHIIELQRQVAPELIASETLHALAKRYDISRTLIRIWVKRFEAGAFDEDAQAANLLEEYEAKIAALERMFCRLKDWRRIAARYDKLATNFAAAVALAAAIIW